MDLKTLLDTEAEKVINGSKTIRRNTLRRIVKESIDNKYIKYSNIVDVYIDSLELNENIHSFWRELEFTFFYIDREDTFYVTKQIFFIYYVAMEYENFTMDLIVDILNEVKNSGTYGWMTGNVEETFIEFLSMNKNLPKDVKLWLKLRKQ